MRRFRWRVSTLLWSVAVLALLLGAERTWQRSSLCKERAVHHANQEKGARLEAVGLELTAESARKWGQVALEKESSFEANYYRSEELHHAKLKREYQRVALHPWLPLPVVRSNPTPGP